MAWKRSLKIYPTGVLNILRATLWWPLFTFLNFDAVT